MTIIFIQRKELYPVFLNNIHITIENIFTGNHKTWRVTLQRGKVTSGRVFCYTWKMFLSFLSHSIGLVVFDLRYRYRIKINPFQLTWRATFCHFFLCVIKRHFNRVFFFDSIEKILLWVKNFFYQWFRMQCTLFS